MKENKMITREWVKAHVSKDQTVVKIPKGYTDITDEAFKDYVSLCEVDLRDVTGIGAFAFEGCKSLSKIDVKKVIEVGDCAFRDCESLKELRFENEIRDSHIYLHSEGHSLYIYDSAFMGCSALSKVCLPDGAVLSNYAFMNCSSLTQVEFSGEIEIMCGVFYGCSSLPQIDLSGVRGAEDEPSDEDVLKDCDALEQVTVHRELNISLFGILDTVTVIRKGFMISPIPFTGALKGLYTHFEIELDKKMAWMVYLCLGRLNLVRKKDGLPFPKTPPEIHDAILSHCVLKTTSARVAKPSDDPSILEPTPLDHQVV